MKIQVGGLSTGIHEYEFTESAAEIGLEDRFSDVHADVTLDKTATQILVRVAIETTGTFTCDRCLASFQKHLTPSYQMHYVWEGADTSRLDPAEVQVISAGTSVIDLNEDIRQTTLVAVPLKLLCQEECKGLCPDCGQDLNTGSCTCAGKAVDTRWEKLQQLKSKDDSR